MMTGTKDKELISEYFSKSVGFRLNSFFFFLVADILKVFTLL